MEEYGFIVWISLIFQGVYLYHVADVRSEPPVNPLFLHKVIIQ